MGDAGVPGASAYAQPNGPSQMDVGDTGSAQYMAIYPQDAAFSPDAEA